MDQPSGLLMGFGAASHRSVAASTDGLRPARKAGDGAQLRLRGGAGNPMESTASVAHL
jgi:hypothetical protein